MLVLLLPRTEHVEWRSNVSAEGIGFRGGGILTPSPSLLVGGSGYLGLCSIQLIRYQQEVQSKEPLASPERDDALWQKNKKADVCIVMMSLYLRYLHNIKLSPIKFPLGWCLAFSRHTGSMFSNNNFFFPLESCYVSLERHRLCRLHLRYKLMTKRVWRQPKSSWSIGRGARGESTTCVAATCGVHLGSGSYEVMNWVCDGGKSLCIPFRGLPLYLG